MKSILWYQGESIGNSDIIYVDGILQEDETVKQEAFALLTDSAVWNKSSLIGKARSDTTAAYKLYKESGKMLIHAGASGIKESIKTSAMFCLTGCQSTEHFLLALNKAALAAGLMISESDLKAARTDIKNRQLKQIIVYCFLLILMGILLFIICKRTTN